MNNGILKNWKLKTLKRNSVWENYFVFSQVNLMIRLGKHRNFWKKDFLFKWWLPDDEKKTKSAILSQLPKVKKERKERYSFSIHSSIFYLFICWQLSQLNWMNEWMMMANFILILFDESFLNWNEMMIEKRSPVTFLIMGDPLCLMIKHHGW